MNRIIHSNQGCVYRTEFPDAPDLFDPSWLQSRGPSAVDLDLFDQLMGRSQLPLTNQLVVPDVLVLGGCRTTRI